MSGVGLALKADHVAVFFISDDCVPWVFEASGGAGVELTEWKTFIDRGWLSLYERYGRVDAQDRFPEAYLPARQRLHQEGRSFRGCRRQ